MSGLAGLFGGKDDFEMPKIQAEQAKRTAEPLEQLSEAAKKSRRLAASFLTQDFKKPKLGKSGILGVGS